MQLIFVSFRKAFIVDYYPPHNRVCSEKSRFVSVESGISYSPPGAVNLQFSNEESAINAPSAHNDQHAIITDCWFGDSPQQQFQVQPSLTVHQTASSSHFSKPDTSPFASSVDTLNTPTPSPEATTKLLSEKTNDNADLRMLINN